MNQQPPDRLLRSFERYLRATNRSERTVGNYLESLHQVETFLQPRGVRLRDATHDRARRRYDGLNAKADSTGFPAEADACRTKAEQLRTKYGL